MKQLSKNKLLIAAAIIWTFIPVRTGKSQSQKDSIIQRVNSFGERVEAVSQKADLIESKLLSYPEKVQTFDSLISLVPKQQSVVKSRARKPVKDKSSAPVLPKSIDVDFPFTEPQYFERPVIIYRTCEVTYGGDTFRTNMWKAPGEDGLLKGIKFFDWLKKKK
jgi:hypothetical protein